MLTAFLMLLAGVGVFIAGMNMLSQELEKSAGGGLKKLLGKITINTPLGCKSFKLAMSISTSKREVDASLNSLTNKSGNCFLSST